MTYNGTHILPVATLSCALEKSEGNVKCDLSSVLTLCPSSTQCNSGEIDSVSPSLNVCALIFNSSDALLSIHLGAHMCVCVCL